LSFGKRLSAHSDRDFRISFLNLQQALIIALATSTNTATTEAKSTNTSANAKIA